MSESAALQEEAIGAIDNANWYEAALLCKPRDFYECLQAQIPGGALMSHHFYEPWHKRGPVTRILVPRELEGDVLDLIEGWDSVASVSRWDREEDDRRLYGDDFLTAMGFFHNASDLAHRGERMTEKLVHCLLNSHGFGIKDEIRFGIKFLWHRLTIIPRLKWRELRTGKKWWEK